LFNVTLKWHYTHLRVYLFDWFLHHTDTL
jgi:hypothetical protein